MDTDAAMAAMQAVVEKERCNGCCMADDELIEPAIRRWNSYGRRLKRHKNPSFEHRTQDLAKGLLEWHIERYGQAYDKSCLGHLAESFAEILDKVVPE